MAVSKVFNGPSRAGIKLFMPSGLPEGFKRLLEGFLKVFGGRGREYGPSPP